MKKLDKDYVEYDKFGLKKVRCMNCGTPVAKRAGIPTGHGRVVQIGIQRLPNWRQVKFEVKIDENPTYIEPIICAECIKYELDISYILDQVKLGYEKEMKSAQKSEDQINRHMKKINTIKFERQVK